MYHTFKVLIYSKFVCSVIRRMGFVHTFICREPAVVHMNDQAVTNVYGSVIFYNQC